MLARWSGGKMVWWCGGKVTWWCGGKVVWWQGDMVTRWCGVVTCAILRWRACIVPPLLIWPPLHVVTDCTLPGASVSFSHWTCEGIVQRGPAASYPARWLLSPSNEIVALLLYAFLQSHPAIRPAFLFSAARHGGLSHHWLASCAYSA